ncbi:ras-related protein rab-14 [Leishmania donovani]|uniref:Ras-related_protein_rab-14_-_putative n=3 Tax=Leishmania donovani species complex TaxID=38574 RepID=A0A6L0WQL4_LEIIN|nr:putative ras-related protein rab-14 [Leishmania infantum JPCM5]XP_003858500.1 ras-related protein rab-14, putative [Leishmania donovani]CAC9448657.1 ras-related_protein_rab-14_-_putative [Leishmania infantum]AYU76229.1 ras-related protein rab-14, putative [Leishmania donovani]TPP45275.1 Ras family protein [Leishmania donovani]TPP52474.1 Ras family protein [Leishmania donovani]CAJ1986295.1 ras-related protein rab-14 [Leishmania donovani]|eukprot:XP_001463263.1 putative ras-related protein rab-14 [Leishmania infantum JPCM5]
MSHKYIFKYIIIGDMSVGKSCLMHLFTEQRYRKDLPHTIGVDFGTTVVDINGELVKLQMWDTAGQERFRSVTRGYYRGAAGALLVYDISRRSTYAHIGTWLTDARANTGPETVFILVGNKSDLEEEREVSYEEAAQFAAEHNLLFVECSSLNGNNVEEVFLSTARRIHEKVKSGVMSPVDPESGVQLHAAAIPTSTANSGQTGGPVDLKAGTSGGVAAAAESSCC